MVHPGLSIIPFLAILLLSVPATAPAQQFETDTLQTASGPLVITFIGHGSLMFSFGGKTIHVDPFSELTDYAKLPKADLVLVTHEHRDHFDRGALEAVMTENSLIVLPELCAVQYQEGIVMRNEDIKTVLGFKIEAVAAYNIVNKRNTGIPYHIKGIGNGYVITFGDKRVYVAGDTEPIPEMKELQDIDVAFVPMNLPFTMTPEMAADAATSIRPKILYPYHFGDSDTAKLVELLKDEPGIEVRIRNMK